MYNLCFIKPNKTTYSETFVQLHYDQLAGNKTFLYGGSFPVYKSDGSFLIPSLLGVASYLIQKRIFKKKDIKVRTNALTAFLKEQKIDVVFCEYGTVGAMVTASCAKANVPLVVHFHGTDAHHRPTLKEYQEYYKKMFSYASYLIAVSEDMREQLKALGAPYEKIIVNPCGVNTAQFTPLDISQSNQNFLAIGRFVYKKSPLSTIRAFKLVSERLPDAHLWMVGDGPLWKEAKQLADELYISSRITFTGVLSANEILSLRERMRCFVQHSVTAENGDMEGTPVSILEASASGLPVVSTRHAGIKQAVIDNITGYLVDEFDIQGMADRMIEIGSSVELAVRMGIEGRKHMEQYYKIEAKTAVLNNAIQRSIDHRKGVS